MADKKTVYVTLSIDVEEEGLFTGSYQCWNAEVKNAMFLDRLQPFIRRGARPTLFCAYEAFANPDSRRHIEKMLPYAEIGAHLHHWNTPPLMPNIPDSGILKSVPSNQVSLSLLNKKLKSLLRIGREICGYPLTSFRMGRWDLHACMFPLLMDNGILCDASVRPLHTFLHPDQGPDFFQAPFDPYWISSGHSKLLEVPLTVTPLHKSLAGLLYRRPSRGKLPASFRHWGAVPLLTVQHPLWLLCAATLAHLSRGGRTLSLTWHSSEMMPGGTPHLRHKPSIDRFLRKISKYLSWLEMNYNVVYAKMHELLSVDGFPSAASACGADWAMERNFA